MGSFVVKSNGSTYGASYLVDSSGQFLVDPTWGIEYYNQSGGVVVRGDGLQFQFYDQAGNLVANSNHFLLAPDALPEGFSGAVN